ncbi:MAG: hypothetical protein B7Y56_14145 [Gallionellales bacterium 35-53-114]|jgi:hypothetical protein|nr:MAG: hypothetical protein B7Y56_14145 [Gallionellales bacterium 35-53-114]OYZ62347.1 MAG: hypothetical protein B7Y04_14395 [Gallionellales bacterium 24-53-125]OZB07387.1 MAG: hypothetical protein B7X61_14815 [Gallionellales bacterium 39-52-133]HQS59560.1 hypothetical protein [Gallionellaceae bacterium]HQS75537.1 hypothetical protein [Gallionellaceae bacterium]
MNNLNSWLFWPDQVALSLLALFFLLTIFLYAARIPAHSVILSVCNLAGHALRFTARWLMVTAEGLRQRNKTVLLAHGQAEVTSQVEREFERVSALVSKELGEYPALQRKMMDELTRIEDDYLKCGEVPPPPPEWVDALSTIANLKSGGDIAKKMLDDLHKSVQKIHDKTISEYRKAYEGRHKILKGLMPLWRSVDKVVKNLDTNMVNLGSNAKAIDAHMTRYEEMRAKTDKSEHTLAISAFVQLGISSLVMLIAVGGAFINFKLIALPMSEMVGASDYITSNLRTSDVAALVIVLMEATMGVFLLESLRITHLFPTIASMNDQLRKRVMWAALILLIILAGIESSLALMRDMLIADKAAMLHDLATVQPIVSDSLLTHIPMIGQMVMGFVLPFVLAFVAIPLEVMVYSLRTVAGVLLVMLMRAISFVLRFSAMILHRLGRILVSVYDISIVLPLLLERWVISLRGSASPKPAKLTPGRAS